MSYIHIENLYRCPDWLTLFPEVYALEKIHGSSAHLRWTGEKLHMHPGGERVELFRLCFFPTVGLSFVGLPPLTVYGEVYGGKCQGMSTTYGLSLRFVVFDVKMADVWLPVPEAEAFARAHLFDFVSWERGPNTLEWLDAQRDAPSVQAYKNGMDGDHPREGVVVRPLVEGEGPLGTNKLTRWIVKHKAAAFQETKTSHEVDPEQVRVVTEAREVAEEYVVPMRLEHVLEKLGRPTTIGRAGDVVRAMLEDIEREAEGEVAWTKEARKAVGAATVRLYREKIG